MNSFLDKLLRWLRYKKIIKHVPVNSIVCDIGCGKEGYFLRKISGLIKYGIGLDEKIKDRKEEKYELKGTRILKEIPLGDGRCDVVVMAAVLEHLKNPQDILNESYRVLKLGGKLILTVPTPLSKPILDFLAFKLKLIDGEEIRDHKNYLWPKEIKKMLARTGFSEGKIKSYYFEFHLNSIIIAQKS